MTHADNLQFRFVMPGERMLNDGLFAFGDEHVGFGEAALLGHFVAVIEMGGVLVASVGAEGEFQASAFCSDDEVLVGDVRDFVDFDGDVSCASKIDDAAGARASPKLLILAGDRNGEKRRPAKDVDGLGGEDLFDGGAVES
jgi:hypothetical protein